MTHYHRSILKRLTVADPDAIPTYFSQRHCEILANPMQLIRRNAKTAARESLMGMSLSYINDIARNIRLDHEYRILVPSDIKAFALADGIELGPVMLAYDLPERILFITGLLDVLAPASVCLSLEPYIISYRRRKASSESNAILSIEKGLPVPDTGDALSSDT